jgi:hypothetical protein
VLSLYDILGDGHRAADVLAWARGRDVPGLPRLSPEEARTLCESWDFGARPGQKWAPGVEFITDIEAGRGHGKTTVGGETINDCAKDPELWGGYACVVGPDPTEVLRDPLFGKAGIFAAAERRERAGLGPGIRSRNLNQRILQFEAPRGGGGGLTVHWAASSDPKSVHGLNVGFAWLEEFGVWYHRKQDEQGNNAWQALRPAIRLGLSKVMITQTPSRSPEVRRLQMDAERPECPACRAAYIVRAGRWRGERGQEPWRLPRSVQVRLHPLLNTRTTVPTRECPACGGVVVASVRCVFGDTTDNPTLSARALADAATEVAAGTAAGRMRFAPRGEVDSGAGGTLVRHEDVLQLECPVFEATARGPVRDRWAAALGAVGAEEVVVDVDPAVTTTDGSDETGVVAACVRQVAALDHEGAPTGDTVSGAVLLEDASVRPSEVEGGAPSSVWAPRAYRKAVLWGASRIVVETNQGGDEVLSAVADLVRGGLTEATALRWLMEEMPEVADPVRLGGIARRMVGSAARIVVESVRRVSDKPTRLEWYGRTAALGRVEGDEASRPWGRQAVLCVPWIGGAQHWQAVLGQITGYEPPREGARRERPRKDRGDAAVSAAQMLLGVSEASAHEVRDPRQDAWMTRTAPR